MFSKTLGGCFSVYTKEVIEKVGGVNPKFIGYGYEHCEHTLRIIRAGLCTGWCDFPHVVNAEEYIQHTDAKRAKSNEQIEKERKRNHKILFKESMANQELVYIPL